jgi:hypothetical protein
MIEQSTENEAKAMVDEVVAFVGIQQAALVAKEVIEILGSDRPMEEHHREKLAHLVKLL